MRTRRIGLRNAKRLAEIAVLTTQIKNDLAEMKDDVKATNKNVLAVAMQVGVDRKHISITQQQGGVHTGDATTVQGPVSGRDTNIDGGNQA